MQKYKEDFINFLLQTGALKAHGDFSLKSKRSSPWFVNIGDFDDGVSTTRLGEAYADAILNSGVEGASAECDNVILYGIPEKGREIVIATANEMARKGQNVARFSTRRVPKDHGEASSVQTYGDARTVREFMAKMQHLSQADRMKAWVLGRAPKNGQSIIQLDDVFTAGDAKYEALEMLKFLGDFRYPLLAIAVDRQEVATDFRGVSAIEEYEAKTGTKVVSIVNANDVYTFLKEKTKEGVLQTPFGEITRGDVGRLENYLRVYGTDAVKVGFPSLDQRIIGRERSVIPACDVETIEEFEKLVKETADVSGIGGYKVGFELGLGYGLARIVETARKHTQKPIIYDHQKAGTDIPDTGKNFARVCRKAGVDAVIFFPQAGPETERAWIYHALDNGLKVIVGGRMTHPAYSVSEGGWITDEGALNMYRIAAKAGIDNFVVPGNKIDVIKQVREVVEPIVGSADYYAPGFIEQGGKIGEGGKAAGKRFHAIVGRGIYQDKDMRAAAVEHTSQI